MKLRAEHITKSFDGKTVLNDVSIHLNEGELVCLLGTSGGGKTTLFHIISGLLIPDSGNIYLDQEEITGQSGHVSYMLQKDMMLPYKKVIDNVSLPLVIQGMKPREARERAAGYFAEFGLDGYENKYPCQMSGGMRQRAALLRTYLFSRDVALLDEPFSALDSITKSSLHTWYLEMMNKLQLSTLFITHDIDEAILLSDRIYILSGEQGRIAAELTIDRDREARKTFALTEEFLEYKRRIIGLL